MSGETITDEELMELLNDEWVSFSQLAELSLEELNALIECSDLQKAFNEYGYSFEELMKLYREDKMHLTCLTASDLTDLVLEYAPNIPAIMMEYAKNYDGDLQWINGELCDSDATLWEIELGYYDEELESEPEDDAYSSTINCYSR